MEYSRNLHAAAKDSYNWNAVYGRRWEQKQQFHSRRETNPIKTPNYEKTNYTIPNRPRYDGHVVLMLHQERNPRAT